MRLINRKRSEKTVVAVRLGRKRRAEWPLLKQLARDNNHGDAFNSIPCTLQSPPGLCDMQAWNNPEGLVVKRREQNQTRVENEASSGAMLAEASCSSTETPFQLKQ
uniref:Uncharacterized protein n=1 Tax=Mus spicilegus TaxID=10103 RepID=A0A8C6I6T5_MUSSI